MNKNEGIYSGKCIDCNNVNTDNKEGDGEFVCTSCSRARYNKKVAIGQIVRFSIDKMKYIKGTVEEIEMILAKNIF